MAEILGIVSGAAGLVGLSGQILQGCLFAKGFFDDAKNAPGDVRQILEELEILEASTRKTEALFQELNVSETIFEERDFEPALKQCCDIFTRFGQKLNEIAEKINAKRPSRWWEMMKVAGRTKVMKYQLVCLERAKSQLRIVQQNVNIALQLKNKNTLNKTASSLFSIQATGTETATKVNRVVQQDKKIMSVVKKTDQNVTGMSKDLQEIKSQITTQSSNTATSEMVDKILTQDAAILATTKEMHQSMASISIGVTNANSQLQAISSAVNALKHHRGQEPISLENIIATAVSKALVAHEELRKVESSNGSQLRPGEVSNTSFSSCSEFGERRRKQTRILTKSEYNAGFFKIEVKTLETLFDFVAASSNTARPGRCIMKLYEIVPNLSLLSRGLDVYYSSSPIPGSLGIKIRSFNVVSYESSIFEACNNLDVKEAKRLFDCGLASPYDRNEDYYYLSLVAFAINQSLVRALVSNEQENTEIGDRLQEFVQYLIENGGKLDGSLDSYSIFALVVQEIRKSPGSCSWRTDLLRLLLPVMTTDPFHCFYFDQTLTLTASQHPIYNFLTQQKDWHLRLESEVKENGLFGENDRHICNDVPGLKLRNALTGSHWHRYEVVGEAWGWDDHPKELYEAQHLNALLRLIAGTKRVDLIQGCRNRLVILLQHGYDPSEVEYPSYIMGYFEDTADVATRIYDGRLLSPTATAIHLGLTKTWYNVLLTAGMTHEEATDLFDSEYYIGVPELIDQTRPFLGRDECRELFMNNLVTGQFVAFSSDEIRIEVNMLIFNLGVQSRNTYYRAIDKMIHEANQAFKQKSTPGSWFDCEEEIRLVPGFDFSWPPVYEDLSWEEILTGQIKL